MRSDESAAGYLEQTGIHRYLAANAATQLGQMFVGNLNL